MNINRYTHYFFRMRNIEDEDDTHYLFNDKHGRTINTDTHYLFRMPNMEDEDKHRYTLIIQGDKHRR